MPQLQGVQLWKAARAPFVEEERGAAVVAEPMAEVGGALLQHLRLLPCSVPAGTHVERTSLEFLLRLQGRIRTRLQLPIAFAKVMSEDVAAPGARPWQRHGPGDRGAAGTSAAVPRPWVEELRPCL
ncbi:hypothetical protein D1007_62451 [Hordeum vulgare]|nr:hypothetical protein D1007_62451 [Hordeum vulgare]